MTDHDAIRSLADQILRTTNMDGADALAQAMSGCCQRKPMGEIQVALAVLLATILDTAPAGLPAEIILGAVEELATRIHRCELPTFGTA